MIQLVLTITPESLTITPESLIDYYLKLSDIQKSLQFWDQISQSLYLSLQYQPKMNSQGPIKRDPYYSTNSLEQQTNAQIQASYLAIVKHEGIVAQAVLKAILSQEHMGSQSLTQTVLKTINQVNAKKMAKKNILQLFTTGVQLKNYEQTVRTTSSTISDFNGIKRFTFLPNYTITSKLCFDIIKNPRRMILCGFPGISKSTSVLLLKRITDKIVVSKLSKTPKVQHKRMPVIQKILYYSINLQDKEKDIRKLIFSQLLDDHPMFKSYEQDFIENKNQYMLKQIYKQINPSASVNLILIVDQVNLLAKYRRIRNEYSHFFVSQNQKQKEVSQSADFKQKLNQEVFKRFGDQKEIIIQNFSKSSKIAQVLKNFNKHVNDVCYLSSVNIEKQLIYPLGLSSDMQKSDTPQFTSIDYMNVRTRDDVKLTIVDFIFYEIKRNISLIIDKSTLLSPPNSFLHSKSFQKAICTRSAQFKDQISYSKIINSQNDLLFQYPASLETLENDFTNQQQQSEIQPIYCEKEIREQSEKEITLNNLHHSFNQNKHPNQTSLNQSVTSKKQNAPSRESLQNSSYESQASSDQDISQNAQSSYQIFQNSIENKLQNLKTTVTQFVKKQSIVMTPLMIKEIIQLYFKKKNYPKNNCIEEFSSNIEDFLNFLDQKCIDKYKNYVQHFLDKQQCDKTTMKQQLLLRLLYEAKSMIKEDLKSSNSVCQIKISKQQFKLKDLTHSLNYELFDLEQKRSTYVLKSLLPLDLTLKILNDFLDFGKKVSFLGDLMSEKTFMSKLSASALGQYMQDVLIQIMKKRSKWMVERVDKLHKKLNYELAFEIFPKVLPFSGMHEVPGSEKYNLVQQFTPFEQTLRQHQNKAFMFLPFKDIKQFDMDKIKLKVRQRLCNNKAVDFILTRYSAIGSKRQLKVYAFDLTIDSRSITQKLTKFLNFYLRRFVRESINGQMEISLEYYVLVPQKMCQKKPYSKGLSEQILNGLKGQSDNLKGESDYLKGESDSLKFKQTRWQHIFEVKSKNKQQILKKVGFLKISGKDIENSDKSVEKRTGLIDFVYNKDPGQSQSDDQYQLA